MHLIQRSPTRRCYNSDTLLFYHEAFYTQKIQKVRLFWGNGDTASNNDVHRKVPKADNKVSFRISTARADATRVYPDTAERAATFSHISLSD